MAMLDGDAYVALLNDLVAATVKPPAGPADAAVADSLGALVLGAWDRLQRRADELDADSPVDDFHRTRIAVKRARYAAELAARSLEGKAAEGAARLGERLAGLQDLLGDVQDAAVAEGVIRETLSARGAGARYAFEAGRLVERLRSRADESMRGFLEEWPEIRRRRLAEMGNVIGPPIRAAGGVVWRRVDGIDGESGVEVAVIHRPRYGDWSLPKGKVSAGESDLEGAVREVLEETGFHVRVGRGLGETRYVKSGGGGMRPKVVRWWAMQAEEGTFSATREVDELRWLSLAEAADQVSRDTDREVLERFARGAAPTRTVLLVRHASAGGGVRLERRRPRPPARRMRDRTGRRARAAPLALRGRVDPVERHPPLHGQRPASCRCPRSRGPAGAACSPRSHTRAVRRRRLRWSVGLATQSTTRWHAARAR